MATQFIVHDKIDTVGVVVVEDVQPGKDLTGWIMQTDETVTLKALDAVPLGHKIALQDLKLPSTQAVILANVLRFTEERRPVTQADLAEVAKVDRMTASQSLQSLELKGYITRKASPGDRRTNRVLLTTKGRRIALEAIKRLAATHNAFFSPLRGETDVIVSYLQQLIHANELA